jgi:hypothetical protein
MTFAAILIFDAIIGLSMMAVVDILCRGSYANQARK